MRAKSTTAQTNALVSKPNHTSAHVRVSVDDGTGSFQDLSDLRGYNWIDHVEYTMSAGEPLMKATVRLIRSAHKMSLAPFVDGSILNESGTVVDIAREIKIESALVPQGASPAASDWELVFHGYIKSVQWQSSPIVLECLDLGYRWMRRFIEIQRVYAETDNLLHEVSQDIADDNHPDLETIAANYTWNGTTTITTSDTSEISVGDWVGLARAPLFEVSTINPGVSFTVNNTGSRTIPSGSGSGASIRIADADRTTLYVEGSNPTWAIKTYVQDKDRVMSALRLLAQQIGYEVSYRWNATTSDFELTLWEPDRTKSTVDASFRSDTIVSFSKVGVDDSNIRNRIKITADTTASGRTTVIREDTASQAKYGVLYMEATEKSSSQIDTVTEMQTMGDAILSDLKEPEVDVSCEVPYRWDLQLGDLVRFESNDVHFDSDQDLAPVSVKHVLPSGGRSKTMITARGTPSGGVQRWLEIEGLPGVSPPVDLRSDNAAENPVADSNIGSIIVTYDDPRAMDPPINDWLYTECHVSTSSGFTPSGSTLAAKGRQTRFEIGDLIPGTTYYSKLVIIDDSGNEAAVSTQVSVATARVGPYHENIDGQQDQLLRNNDFNIYTNGTGNDPDFWENTEGSVSYSTDSKTGASAQAFVTSGVGGNTPILDSDYIPITSLDLVQVGAYVKASAANEDLDVDLRWYNRSKVFLSASSVTFTLTTSFETYQSATIMAANGAAFVKVRLLCPYNGSTSETITVDRVGLVRSYALGSVGTASALAFSTSLLTMEWNDADIESDDVGVTHVGPGATLQNDEIEIDYPGLYMLQADVESDSGSSGTSHSLEVIMEVDEGGAGSYVTVGSGQASSATTGGNELARAVTGAMCIQMSPGDLVRVRAKTSIGSGAGRNLFLNRITVRQLVRADQ